MTNWVVRRWARYGHERLYAETPGGTALGYLDLTTGLFHSDDVANLPLLEQAVRDHLAADHEALRPGPAIPANDPGSPAEFGPADAAVSGFVEDAWVDISGALPGAAARQRAIAERQAQGPLRHLLARAIAARTDERAWRIGADGEEAVADQLAKLGTTWRLLHAVRVGERDSDIDHVVIGPAGVFTVNAKHHPHTSVWVGGDTFMVNGQRVPYIRNSRHEARRASRLLTQHAGFPVQVTGLIAVMGAHKGFKVKKQPEDGAVFVIQRRRIGQHLRRLPTRLSAREIDAIYEVARRSTTWR